MGGNVGDVAATLSAAESQLHAHPQIRVVSTSRRYQTAPVGAEAGASFVNSAVEIESDLDPHALLECTQSIENGLGRVRTIHWGPRTLDIDLLFTDPSFVMAMPRLTLPHPHLWYRRFVLEPLCDLAAGMVIAPYQHTASELASRWRMPDWRVGVHSSVAGVSQDSLVHAVSKRFPSRRIMPWTPGQPRPELLALMGEVADVSPPFLTLHDDVPTATQALVDAITAAQDQPVPID